MPVGIEYFGASVPKTEDPRLLRGHARDVDDITLLGVKGRGEVPLTPKRVRKLIQPGQGR
jgi:hypothetical protein